jgi:hypothetical protein
VSVDNIGRYRVEQILGTGAFGTVWLGYDETLDARVAIKVLAENWARDESFHRRFIEEARILWRAESDYVVRVHTVDELPDGRPYFVMDYADKGSLQDRMKGRFDRGESFSVDEALTISRQIAEGLRVVHALGIAHRDLKPANIMYRSLPEHTGGGGGERLVLVDFGIAKNLAGTGATTIATGTPYYMAPEQTEGRADRRSDVYSAAVVLYELLARAVPYPYESVGQLIRAQSAQSFTPLHELRSDVPPRLNDAITRGLKVEPEARFADADAWLAALDDDHEDRPVPAPEAPAPAAGGMTMSPAEMRAQQAAGLAAAGLAGGVADVAGASPAAAASAASGAAGPPPPPRQPPPPPTPAQAPPPSRPPRRRRGRLVVTLIALVALLATGIGAVLATSDKTADGPNSREVFGEPIASLGRNAFAPPVTPNAAELAFANPSLAGLEPPVRKLPSLRLPKIDLARLRPGKVGIPSVSGATPGLYGGTNLLSVCDAKKLVSFLQTNADKARAWAKVIGVGVDSIPAYVAGLTDVILRADTRVTNHGFANGKATFINSVLQAGTAVLIDRFGVPVVRCKCGNPLTPPQTLAARPQVIGTTWPGFSLPQTVVIVASNKPVASFTTANVLTGAPLVRRPGPPKTPGTSSSTRPSTTVTASTSTSTSTTTTTVPVVPVDVTSRGSGSASSEFSGQYPASLALDGNIGTSWFSGGSNVDGEASTYRWQAPADMHITRVEVIGNAGDTDANTRSGFGFNSVDIQVLGGNGAAMASGSRGLGGTPDPDVSIDFSVTGRIVLVTLHGHEAANCGGFAELRVFGTA